MPEEIFSGDAQEGAVPAPAGDAAGSTDDSAVNNPVAGTADEASASVELPEALRDKYIPVERYQNLESKLGNWSEVEKQAALYQQLSQDPRIQAALQPAETPAELPDFSTMQSQDVIGWLDKRTEERAQKLFDQRIEQFWADNIDPMAKDVYARQANEMVQKLEEKYPDFKDKRQAIINFLDQNPGLTENLNEKSLEMAYRFVAFEEQQQKGAKDAVKKLQTKAKESAVKPQGSAPAGKAKPKTIADAWAQAEEAGMNT